MSHVRNYRNVVFEGLRTQVEPRFTALHDKLENAYYGTPQLDSRGELTARAQDGWKHGVSHPITIGSKTFDVQANPRESKLLFDKLHGLIFHKLQLAMIAQNEANPEKIPLDRLDPPELDRVTLQPTGRRDSDISRDVIATLASEGLDITI